MSLHISSGLIQLLLRNVDVAFQSWSEAVRRCIDAGYSDMAYELSQLMQPRGMRLHRNVKMLFNMVSCYLTNKSFWLPKNAHLWLAKSSLVQHESCKELTPANYCPVLGENVQLAATQIYILCNVQYHEHFRVMVSIGFLHLIKKFQPVHWCVMGSNHWNAEAVFSEVTARYRLPGSQTFYLAWNQK